MTLQKLTPQAIIEFLQDRQGRASKAEIAKHFGVKGNDRIGLKGMLKDMLNRKQIHQGTFRSYTLPGLPKRAVNPEHNARNKRVFENRVEREELVSFFGLYQPTRTGGMVLPVSRKDKSPVMVLEGKTLDAHDGDFVRADYHPRGWKIEEILARKGDAGMVSLMAIKTLEIPDVFPSEVIAETKGMIVPELGDRTDLRDIPLVTIDGEDARDFDDAVWATADITPDNIGGWQLLVAIADVSHYVRPNSALDEEAYARGNSVYFPDRVVPMLPEALSNDLCSLRPHEERACMAAQMRINKFGNLIDVKVVRGLMKSVARLTYNEVQAALDGQLNEKTAPILDTLIKPLYGAYETLLKARTERGAVELDLPERKVVLKDGKIDSIQERQRFDSHKLIEEFMVLANVAVAEVLEEKHQMALYRIHPKPDNARWAATKEFLQELGLRPKSSLTPSPMDLQFLLQSADGRDEAPLVHEMILRTMSQASYHPDNVGHFGLALESYAHFTSPIRRYADLIVHRALIRTLKLGSDGLTDYEEKHLEQIGSHISDRERVAQSAERETIDRYIALYLEDRVGATFPARISGVTRFGIFVNIQPTGADGLIPIRSLPNDYYEHDEKRHALIGQRTGLTFRITMPVTVRLIEVDSATGRLLMELLPGSITIPPQAERQRPHRRDPGERMEQRSKRYESRPGDRSGGRDRRSGPPSRGGKPGPKRGK